MAEQAKALDNADAYRGLLTHYDAKFSLFKEIHPYLAWALHFNGFVLLPYKRYQSVLYLLLIFNVAAEFLFEEFFFIANSFGYDKGICKKN